MKKSLDEGEIKAATYYRYKELRKTDNDEDKPSTLIQLYRFSKDEANNFLLHLC